jgi:hypothetical protein
LTKLGNETLAGATSTRRWIEVALFDSDLMSQLEELNRDFTRDQAGAQPLERTAAQTADPAHPDKAGPNGHRIGYTDEG